MRAWRPILDVPHVEHPAAEVNLVPAQVADLGRAEPVPESDEDHGRIPMAVAVGLGGLDRGFDLAGRQVLAGAKQRSVAASAQLFGKLQLARPAGAQNVSMKSPCPRGNCSNFT